MPPITSSTASVFPTSIDTFTRLRNSVGVDSVINSDTWNKMLAAIYRLQLHNRKIVRVGGDPSASRKRVFSLATVVNGGLVVSFTHTFTLTSAEIQFLGNSPFREGNLIFADVYALSGAAAGGNYTADIQTQDNDKVIVRVRHLDPTNTFVASVPAGNFRISLTILGF